jgi:hypothetical protein
MENIVEMSKFKEGGRDGGWKGERKKGGREEGRKE